MLRFTKIGNDQLKMRARTTVAGTSHRRRLLLERLEDRRLLAGAQSPTSLSGIGTNYNPSQASVMSCTVSSDEPASEIDTAFQLASGTSTVGASVTQVVHQNLHKGHADLHIVAVNSGAGDELLRPNVPDNHSIRDQQEQQLSDNGTFHGGESHTIDKTVSTVTSISLIGTLAPNASNIAYDGASSVHMFDSGSFLLNESLTTISGLLYDDLNSNGTQDAGESPRSGFTVYVDSNRNGDHDAGEPWAISAADGSYTIDNVTPGNVLVRVITDSESAVTSPMSQMERLFVASGSSLREFDPITGSQISSFSISPVPTRGASSAGLAFDGTTVFMIDSFDNRILRIDPSNGTVLSALGPLPNAVYGGLAYVNSILYASDNTMEQILAVNPETGAVVSTLNVASLNAGSPFHPGPIDLLGGLGESADGTQLLAATASRYRLIINPTSGVVEGAYTDLFDRDLGLAGGAGRIYVGRRGPGRIEVFDSAGTLTNTLSDISVPDDLAAFAASTPGASLTVLSDQQVTGINFGIESTIGSISGHQFVDTNSNGSFDAGEEPLAGVTVYVDTNNNRLYDLGEPSTVSAADGSYTITQVPRGKPVVRTLSAPGYESAALRSSTEHLYGARPRLSTFPSDVNVSLIDPQTGAEIDGFGTLPSVTVNNLSSIGFDGDRFYFVDNGSHKLIQTSVTGQFVAEAALPGLTTAQTALGVAVIGGTIYVPANGGGMPFQLWRYDPQLNQFVSPIPISTNTSQSPILPFLPALSLSVSESPDGRSILLFSNENNAGRVFLLNPLTGRIDTTIELPDSLGNDFAAASYDGELYLRLSATSSTIRVYNSNYVFQRTIPASSFLGLASGVVRDLGTAVTLASLSVSNVNVPHRPISIASGTVSIDANFNGMVDPGELASGVTLYVDSNRNGVFDNGEPNTTTFSDGSYTFLGLPQGDHAIRVQPTDSTLSTRTLQTETSLYGLRSASGVSTIFKHDAITGQVLRQFTAPGNSGAAAGMAINEHGLYYSSSGEIWRLNPEDGTVFDQWLTPGVLYDGLASIGGFLFALNSSSDSIAKINPLSGQVVTTFNINAINGTQYDLVGGLGESSSGTHLIVNVGSSESLILINPNNGAIAGNVNSSQSLAIAGAGGELFRSGSSASILVENLSGTTPYSIRSVPVAYSAYALAAATLNSKEYVIRSGYPSDYSKLDFRLVPPAQPGSVTGRVYRDDDGDGVQDPGEVGMEGVIVYLDLNANGILDVGEPNQFTWADDLATPSIDETGQYEFVGLTPGQYLVRLETPPSLELTAPQTAIASTTDRYDTNFAFVGFQHHPDDDIRLSATGRYLVYSTNRRVLPADTNSRRDIYLVDRYTGIHELISVNNSGVLGNANHFEPDVSEDGRFVTFRTGSINFDSRDTNGAHDILIRDRHLGTTTLLTVPVTGTVGAGGHTADAVITPDGQHVLFYTAGANLRSDDTNSLRDTFVWSRSTGVFDRISVSAAGSQLTDGGSFGGDISADGRYVVFESASSQIDPADVNGVSDIYWKDRVTGDVRLVSASMSGVAGNDKSQKRTISDDGRWVAFDSFASNLTSDPHPGPGVISQVYLKDMHTGAIKRISLPTGSGASNFNAQRPEISGDGRFVVFESDGVLLPADSNELVDVYLYDRLDDMLRLVSRGDNGATANGPSNNAVISRDGTTIAYTTSATNIGGTNSVGGVVVADVQLLVGVHAVDITPEAGFANLDFGSLPAVGSISGTDFIDGNNNGTLDATDLRLSGRTFYVDLNRNGQIDAGEPSAVSQTDDPDTPADETGQYLISGVPKGQHQIRQVLPEGWQQTIPVPATPSVSLASVNNYQPGINDSFYPRFDSVLSRDGRYVAFSTNSQLLPLDTNSFYDIYVLDRQTNELELVSLTAAGGLTNNFKFNPTISGDGRFVAFQSFGNNLVSGDTNGQADVFLRDRLLGTTILISRAMNVLGNPTTSGNSYSYNPQLSGDGRYLTFWSAASDIVAGDTNGMFDLFSITLATGVIERISKGFDGSQAIGGNSHQGFMSYDGRYIAFHSHATNLVANDTNGMPDVFVYDRNTGLTERVSTTGNGEQGGAESVSATISDDGRFVAFKSRSGNFVGSPNTVSHQIFIKDRQIGTLTHVSQTESGSVASGAASQPAISGDGRWVVYDSPASTLASGDNNGLRDVFLYDALSGTTQLISRNSSGQVGNGTSEYPMISRDGSTITFLSNAENLANQTIGGLYLFDNSGSIGSSPAVTVAIVTGQEASNVNFASRPIISTPTITNGTVAEGGNVYLDLSNLLVPDGVIVNQWQVDWGDGTVNHFDTRRVAPMHVYASVGSWVITLSLLTNVGTISHETTIEIEVVSAAPTDISLSTDSINENVDTSGADILFATLTAEDATTSDSHTFMLVAGIGDTDNGSFVISGNALKVRQGVTLDYETKPSYSILVKVADATGLVFEKSVTLQVNNLIEISKSNVVINSGSVQRSRVDSVTVEFDTEVILQAGAITVHKRGFGGGLVTTLLTPVVGTASRTFSLSFTGTFSEFGSLVDGNFELHIDAAKIVSVGGFGLDANRDGVTGDNFVFGDNANDKFFRLFGDADGDRDVDALDLLQFRRSLNQLSDHADFRSYFDETQDGDVDSIDLLRFRQRLNQTFVF